MVYRNLWRFAEYRFCFFGVCFWVFIPLLNVSLVWKRHHYWWRAQDFAYTRHSWPLSNEGSLACHTFCDTGHRFIMVICADCDTPSVAERLAVELPVTTCDNDIGLGFEHPTFRMQSECFNQLRHRRGPIIGTIRQWVLEWKSYLHVQWPYCDNIRTYWLLMKTY